MNENLETILWLFGIIAFMILLVWGVVLGVGQLTTKAEQSQCNDLTLEGHDARMVEDTVGSICKLVYKGVFFDANDLDKILMLKLIDTENPLIKHDAYRD